jgi:hypothetical protein
MNYILKTMDGQSLELSEEEAKVFFSLEDNRGWFDISRLKCRINISSVSGLYAEDTVLKDEITCDDGTVVVRKFGLWVLKSDPTKRIDMSRYPELSKDYVKPLPIRILN